MPIWRRGLKNPIKDAHSLPDSPNNCLADKNGSVALRYKFSPPITNKNKFSFNDTNVNKNNQDEGQQFSPFV